MFTLNEDDGTQIYAGLVKKLIPKDNTVQLIGQDFREIFNTEILLDYRSEYYTDLQHRFSDVTNIIKNNTDLTHIKIPISITIPVDTTNTLSVFGSLSGQIFAINAYQYLLTYLKYYGYILRSTFDWSQKKIVFTFDNVKTTYSIKLQDFSYELSQNDVGINKVIAGMNNDYDPASFRYYYLDKNNNIVDGDEVGNIPDRYYPVRCKYYLEDYLADAQYKAILELCNQRYVDTIYIDSNSPLNPIDITTLKLNDLVEIYTDSLYKTLPVSEIILKIDSTNNKRQVKLGFKKDKLT